MAGAFCPHCMSPLREETGLCPTCGGDVTAVNQEFFLPVGTTLADPTAGRQYLLGMAKGAGGFGVTYIGLEKGTDRLVAVKEFYPTRCQPVREADGSLHPPAREQSAYDHGIKSFLEEADMLKRVSAIPSMVKVRSSFRANGTAYMVMDYVKGETLQRRVETQGPMDFGELMKELRPMAEDLAKVHDAKVIHRDIAPDNIILSPEGGCKLLDFGCARSMEDGRSMTVVLKGGFAPLEQYTGHGQSAYTDVYALCATIYYAVTGEIPVDSPTRLSAKDEGQPDPLKPPTSLGAKMTQEEERALLWGMGLQPNDRPKGVRQLLERLPPPYPIPPWKKILRKISSAVKNNKLLAALIALVVLAVVLALLFV